MTHVPTAPAAAGTGACAPLPVGAKAQCCDGAPASAPSPGASASAATHAPRPNLSGKSARTGMESLSASSAGERLREGGGGGVGKLMSLPNDGCRLRRWPCRPAACHRHRCACSGGRAEFGRAHVDRSGRVCALASRAAGRGRRDRARAVLPPLRHASHSHTTPHTPQPSAPPPPLPRSAPASWPALRLPPPSKRWGQRR